MAIVTLGLAVVPSGNVKILDEVPAKLDKMDRASRQASIGMSGMADGIGKVSTTLARSVGVLGLSSDSLRALDDASDLAELGLRGMDGGLRATVTSANLFSTATLGAVGAAAALGAGIGTLLLKIPAVQKAADSAAESLHAMFFGPKVVDPGLDAKTAALIKQGQAAREAFVRGGGKIVTEKELSHTEKLLKIQKEMEEQAKKAAEAIEREREAIEQLARAASGANLEAELERQAKAIEGLDHVTEEFKKGIAENVTKAMAEGLVIPASLIPIQQEVLSKQLDEIVKGAIEKTEQKSLKGPIEDMWKRVLGGGVSGGIGDTAAGKDMLERVDLSRVIQDNAQATFDWAQQLENVANMAATLPGFFGKALTAVLGGVAGIGASLKEIGGLKGLGSSLSGKGGLGGILAGAGVIGSVIGGAVGIFKGIFGDSKRKAEELKKKQQEAMDSFASMFDEWKQARDEMAGKLADGVTSLVDSLFEGGKFQEGLTSASNAAEYVVASFNTLRAQGLSFSEALARLGPAIKTMAQDAKKFAGTAAAPLVALAKIAGENEKLLQFQAGLADTAIGLASFGAFTQDIALKMGADLSGSIDKLIDRGATYDQALALSAENLFKLQQAAQKGQVTLDGHTQKMIDDAASAGLFEGLQDPMQKLINATQGVAAGIGAMVQLMGGAVPAALQKMIDEFNSAQINIGSSSSSTSTTPEKTVPDFQHGGFLPERSGGAIIRVARPGTGGEHMVPGKQMDVLIAAIHQLAASRQGGGATQLVVNGRVLAEVVGESAHGNRGELLSLINDAQRRRGRG